jgi:fucose permease
VVIAGLCCVSLVLYAVYLEALGVLLPVIGATFHLGPAAEGQMFPANFGGFILGVLLSGFLSDRLGRKPMMLGGTVCFTVGLALFGLAPNYALVLLGTALIGAGTGSTETVGTALAADLFPERRAFVINLLQVAFGIGAVFSPSLVHHLLVVGTSWHLLFLALSAMTLLLLLALALQPVPPLPHSEESLDMTALRAILRHPAFLALCLAEALYVGAEVGFSSWMPTYFEKRLIGGAPWAGFIVTVFWVGMTIGRAATGALLTRLSLLRLTLLLALGGAAGAILALFGTTPGVVMAFVLWTGLCFSGIFGLILGEAAELYPRMVGTAFGLAVASGGIGGALLPWAIGEAAGTSIGWRGALALVPVSILLLAITLTLLERKTAASQERV